MVLMFLFTAAANPTAGRSGLIVVTSKLWHNEEILAVSFMMDPLINVVARVQTGEAVL